MNWTHEIQLERAQNYNQEVRRNHTRKKRKRKEIERKKERNGMLQVILTKYAKKTLLILADEVHGPFIGKKVLI